MVISMTVSGDPRYPSSSISGLPGVNPVNAFPRYSNAWQENTVIVFAFSG